jgi:hypothetical protein
MKPESVSPVLNDFPRRCQCFRGIFPAEWRKFRSPGRNKPQQFCRLIIRRETRGACRGTAIA